jgi:hypothetical protein
MELNIKAQPNLGIDFINLQKLSFINNAIESGWNVSKKNNKYIFCKKHEGKKEVFLESYLQKFIEDNLVNT